MDDLFAYAQQRRDTGMAQAAEAQERKQPGFGTAAYDAIVRIAKRQATVHVDDVLAECPIKPQHHNAWGSVWSRAIRANVISPSSERRPCKTDPKKNAHSYPVYISIAYAHRWESQ